MTLARPLLTPVLIALAATVLLVLQSSLVPIDLLFLLCLAVAARWGAFPATAAGWWGGLLMGALRGNLSLPMALLYGFTGFCAGVYCDTTHRERLLDQVSLIAALSLLLSAGEAVLLISMGLTLETARAEILPQLVANLALGLPILLLLPSKR